MRGNISATFNTLINQGNSFVHDIINMQKLIVKYINYWYFSFKIKIVATETTTDQRIIVCYKENVKTGVNIPMREKKKSSIQSRMFSVFIVLNYPGNMHEGKRQNLKTPRPVPAYLILYIYINENRSTIDI